MTQSTRTVLLAAAMLAAGLLAGTLLMRLRVLGGGPVDGEPRAGAARLAGPIGSTAPAGGNPGLFAPTGTGRCAAAEPAWPAQLGARSRFFDATACAGIGFVHTNGLSGDYHYLEMMGAGVAFFDYDADGWLDLYFVNGNRLWGEPDPAVTNGLYRNQADGTFADVTASAGVGDPGYGQGCCVGDFDNDGDRGRHPRPQSGSEGQRRRYRSVTAPRPTRPSRRWPCG